MKKLDEKTWPDFNDKFKVIVSLPFYTGLETNFSLPPLKRSQKVKKTFQKDTFQTNIFIQQLELL